MKVLNLCCGNAHSFEGWFASEDDYQSQRERALIECPMCADTAIAKLPTAPHLSVAKVREPANLDASPETSATTAPVSLQTTWLRAVQHVLANTVDVGEMFPQEARRIHYGEVEQRPIRGRASSEEVLALQEEGIELVSLPLPAAVKGEVQ